MKKILKSVACIIIAYIFILIPYMIYFIRSIPYDPLLDMPVDNLDAFDSPVGGFIWSVFVGAFFYIHLRGRKNSQQASEEVNRKKLLLEVMVGTGCICAIGFVLDQYYYGRLFEICEDFYYTFTNTMQCVNTGTFEQFQYLTFLSQYFARAIIPDLMKMMDLIVVFLSYQGLRFWSSVRIRGIVPARESGK